MEYQVITITDNASGSNISRVNRMLHFEKDQFINVIVKINQIKTPEPEAIFTESVRLIKETILILPLDVLNQLGTKKSVESVKINPYVEEKVY